MTKIDCLDDVIPFSRRHRGETIREIIRYDSGYLKDLFLNDDELCFSKECFREICRLTVGHFDNWETPSKPGLRAYRKLKILGSPYLYDFNQLDLLLLNEKRLKVYDK